MMTAQAPKARRHQKGAPWNSLEITKILVAAMTPVAIAILGIAVGAANAEQARLSRALDRRLEIWNTVGPQVRQMKDQAALIYMNSAPNLPEGQRAETIGSQGVRGLMQSVDEMLEVRPFFTPVVMQSYLDFSTCALELVQATEFNSRKGAKPYSRQHLKQLWNETNENYAELIGRVRVELSTEASLKPDILYPQRVTGTSDRDTSVCLGKKT